MRSNINIEEIFSSNLSEIKVKPSSENWTGINSKLSDKEMETFFHDKLATNPVNPSSSVWKGIANSMPASGFWQFGLNTLNIYSAVALVAVLVGIVFVVIPVQNKTSVTTPEENIVNISDNLILDNENFSKVNGLSNTERNGSDGSSNFNGGGKIVVDKPFGNQSSSPLILTDGEEEKRKDNNESSKKKSKDKENSNNEESTLIQKDIVENQYVTENSMTYIDTLVIYDTIQYYDTLIVENIELVTMKNSISNWSITPRIGVFSAQSVHTGSNSNSSEMADIYNQATNNNLSFSYGIGANYDYKAWRISSGLDYTLIQEEFNYETREIETAPVTKYTLSENGHYMNVVENITYVSELTYDIIFDTISATYTVNEVEYENYSVIDTIWRYKVDSTIIQVSDSIAVINYDTVRIATYDTAYYNSIDTNVYTTYYQNINKYTYIDIPLMVGYGFNIKKFTIRPTVGAIFGIMLNAKGKGVSMQDRNIVYTLDDSDLPFMNLQVSMLIGLGIEYRIQENLLIYVQPFYRRNLTSVYKSSVLIDKRFTGIGASFGLSFYFD